MENLSEIIVICIAGIILGLLIGYILFKKFKLDKWIKNKKLNKVIKNLEILKKKLEENGEIIDMGKKIHIEVIESPGGKGVLNIIRDPKMKEDKPKPKKKKKRKIILDITEKDLRMIEAIGEAKNIELESPEEQEEEILEDQEEDLEEPEEDLEELDTELEEDIEEEQEEQEEEERE
jgi:hypothetical protein